MPRLGRTLAARILLAVLGIVVVTLAVGFALFARLTVSDRRCARDRAGHRDRGDPRPGAAGGPGSSRTVTPVTPAAGPRGAGAGLAPGASYVVIIDRTAAVATPTPTRPSSDSASRSPWWRSTGRCTRASTRAASAGPPTRGRPSSTPSGRPVGRGVGRHPRVRGRRPARRRDARHRPLRRRSPSPSAWRPRCCSPGRIKRVTFGVEPAEIVGADAGARGDAPRHPRRGPGRRRQGGDQRAQCTRSLQTFSCVVPSSRKRIPACFAQLR